MSKERSNGRVEILDVAKGFSIILMTLVHYPFTQQENIYPGLNFLVDDVLMIFVVPIFIFISGYLISDSKSFKVFFFSKIDGLIKPLFGFLLSITLLNILVFIITSNKITPQGIIKYINAFLSVFIYGDLGFVNYALWFIGALFWALLLLKISLVIIGLKGQQKYAYLALLVLLLFCLSYTQIKFYYLAYVPVFFIFLALGYGFKIVSKRFLKGTLFFYSKIMIVFPMLFLILCFVLYKFNVRTDLDLFLFVFNYHYLLVLSIVGIFFVFFLCRYFEKIPLLKAILVKCSKASIFILGFHVFILDVFKLVFDLEVYNPLLHFVLFVLNIVLCYTIYSLIIKIPFLRLIFIPLKGIEFSKNEIKLLKYKPIYRFIPKEVIVIT